MMQFVFQTNHIQWWGLVQLAQALVLLWNFFEVRRRTFDAEEASLIARNLARGNKGLKCIPFKPRVQPCVNSTWVGFLRGSHGARDPTQDQQKKPELNTRWNCHLCHLHCLEDAWHGPGLNFRRSLGSACLPEKRRLGSWATDRVCDVNSKFNLCTVTGHRKRHRIPNICDLAPNLITVWTQTLHTCAVRVNDYFLFSAQSLQLISDVVILMAEAHT